MLEQYLRAAQALGLDIDKIYLDCVISAVRSEQLKEAKRKMRKDLK